MIRLLKAIVNFGNSSFLKNCVSCSENQIRMKCLQVLEDVGLL